MLEFLIFSAFPGQRGDLLNLETDVQENYDMNCCTCVFKIKNITVMLLFLLTDA